jgi:hypothetical protein
MPAPFILTQLTGPQRALVLRGRALPFRGGSWESEMSVDLTWYPGVPVANSQVIGFRELPSTFNGRWSDKLLFDASDVEGVTLINFPAVSAAGLPTASINAGSSFAATGAFPVGSQRARLVQTVLDAMDLILREGQKLRVSWGTRVRYGYLVRAKDTPARGNDTEWEIEFKWTGRSESFPTRVAPKVNTLSTKAVLSKLLAAFLAALALLEGTSFLNRIQGAVGSFLAAVTALLDALSTVNSLRFAPQQLLNTLKAALQLIKADAARLRRELANNRGASQEAAEVGLPDAAAIAKLAQSQFRERIQEIAAFATEQQRLLAALESGEVLATIVTQGLTTLRDLSSRFYATPNNWTKIASFNSFAGSTVPAGTTVLIPKLT